jgi:toxin ParE1/3/4
MANQYILSDSALRDLSSINDYLFENCSPELAERFLEMIDTKCDRLVQYPQMGRKRDELAIGLRSFPAQKYLIFYRIIPIGIEVIRVASGYQDLEYLFKE